MVRAIRPPAVDSVYHAIQEPTRRALLDLLAEGERPVGRLAARFEMTRPAISQHLKVLKDAGLVHSRRAGRENLYRLEAAPLKAVHEWVFFYQRFWSEHPEALGRHLDQGADAETEKKPRK